MDFYEISETRKSNGVTEIYPEFFVGTYSDLMIKGGDFYAVWIEEKKLWSTNENDLIKIIDRDIRQYIKDNKARLDGGYSAKYMRTSSSGSIDRWHKYCQRQMRDNFVQLDATLIFSNQETTKESYATKKLPYALEEGSHDSYDKLIGTLYSPEEKAKLEWAIGAIVAGDSVNIQKFIVLYGDRGTGKSTFLDIVKKLFQGYWTSFEAKALGSVNNAFALEAFKDNPLVAIDPEAKLDRIEDNTKINSLTAHEAMFVNAKYEKMYSTRFNSFLFMGTNSPVKITDAKSGILRRLIDVNPTGNKVPKAEYNRLVKNINYELGAIAKHCLDVYLADPDKYDDYVPVNMLAYTNDFYNFIIYNFDRFEEAKNISLQKAWEWYDAYCADTNTIKVKQRIFATELQNYFDDFVDRYTLEDGTRVRSYFIGFKTDKFESKVPEKPKQPDIYSIEFKVQPSLLDDFLKDCPAQYAYISDEKTDRPERSWDECKTTLKDLDTSRLHYILPKGHENLIRLDFDIRGEDGEKDPDLNLKEASKWPKTYAERSKSGAGIHLYYIYTGDTSKLQNHIASDIEIKTSPGKSAIRRKLTVCNDIPITTLSSGLPLKGDKKKMVEKWVVQNDKEFERFLTDCFKKKHHGNTIQEVNYIAEMLQRKYDSGEPYDYTSYFDRILAFANASHNSKVRARKVVLGMKFKSEAPMPENIELPVVPERPIVIFDCEVFPNLFVVCYKFLGSAEVKAMINPSPEDVAAFIDNNRLIGFNNKDYDNHILYKRRLGGSLMDLFQLSQSIIQFKTGKIPQAKHISFSDIFDYSSKKQSLKKWEIEMETVQHKELGLRWDEPVPKELWDTVVSYCKNDVLATEALYYYIMSDFLAREILADLGLMTVNDSTNNLTARIIFGRDKNPQREFKYRDLSKPVLTDAYGHKLPESALIFTAWNGEKSAMPFFPGYEFKNGKSTYRGEEIGEGGKVYAEPGIYYDVPVFDVTSMHPHSIIAENLFGKYTVIFKELVDARVFIKHAIAARKKGNEDGYSKNLDLVRALPHIGAKLNKYLDDYEKLKNLPQALKIAINSVYGMTAAKFDNPFRDPRNVDNIVAKRGALFMTDLKLAVQEKGFKVIHIKTDSIKIPGATSEIKKFVEDFGHKYGYSFEVEEEYEKICLVNDAVYIAKFKEPQFNQKTGKNDIWWDATGTQFQVPYVFKTLFSKEPIEFDDMCETKSVKTAIYLDFNEGLEDPELQEKYKDILRLERLGQDMHVELNNVQRLIDEKCHKYTFVGKVGRFCPIAPGYGGGELLREQNGKYYAVTGTKGFLWKESEVVRQMGLEYQIDRSYYNILCQNAIEAVNKAGEASGITYDIFVSDEKPIPEWISVEEATMGELLPFESDEDLPF